jgi:hypothetical protein
VIIAYKLDVQKIMLKDSLIPQATDILEKYGYKFTLISNNKGSENLKKKHLEN